MTCPQNCAIKEGGGRGDNSSSQLSASPHLPRLFSLSHPEYRHPTPPSFVPLCSTRCFSLSPHLPLQTAASDPVLVNKHSLSKVKRGRTKRASELLLLMGPVVVSSSCPPPPLFRPSPPALHSRGALQPFFPLAPTVLLSSFPLRSAALPSRWRKKNAAGACMLQLSTRMQGKELGGGWGGGDGGRERNTLEK